MRALSDDVEIVGVGAIARIAGRTEVADFMTSHAKVVLIVGDLPPVVGHRPLFPRRWRSPCRKDPRRVGVERAVDHQRVVRTVRSDNRPPFSASISSLRPGRPPNDRTGVPNWRGGARSMFPPSGERPAESCRCERGRLSLTAPGRSRSSNARCCMTPGKLMFNGFASSLTDAGPRPSCSISARRWDRQVRETWRRATRYG